MIMAPLIFWASALDCTRHRAILICRDEEASNEQARDLVRTCGSNFSGSDAAWLGCAGCAALVGAGGARRGVDRADSWQLEATVRIPSIRGEIRDRNGITLVQNRASYEVDFYLPEMVKGYRQRYGQPPLTVIARNINGMPKDLKEADIVKIVNDGIVPRLDDLDLARDYNAGQLQKHYRTNTEVPYSYIKDIDFPTMAKFSEHDVGLPGVDIAIKPVRSYVYGALAAHLLGYVGPPDDTNKEEASKFTFYQSDVDGKSNVEKTMDQYLRGRPGIRYLRRNAKGTIDGVLREDPPMQGANVYLTIDARIQAIAEEAIRAVARGAAVVVDPNNGDVLAMVSVPSFDPNTFIPSIKAKDWARVAEG